MTQKKIVWPQEAIVTLIKRYQNEPTIAIAQDLKMTMNQVYRKAKSLGLKKSQEYLNSPAACRLRPGDNVGAGFRFKPAQVPWNKGLKGLQIGGESTQFQPGQLPKNYKSVGSERISKDGYLQRKITDTGYPPNDWVGVHILIWEQHHGSIPPGHVVVFKDKNKTNLALNNLECITRVELMKRNTHRNLPKELSQLITLRGAITRQIRKRERNEQ